MMPDTAIRPELVAAKLASAENLERPSLAEEIEANPRLVELVWFIQWRSLQPGGLAKFSRDLLSSFRERFISRAMQAVGPPRAGRYSAKQFLTICKAEWKSLDAWHQDIDTDPGLSSFEEWLGFHFHPDLAPESVQRAAEVLAGFERFNWDFFKARCEERAAPRLPSFLRDLCAEKTTGFSGTEYCPDLLQTIFDYMGRQASEAERKFARTEIAEKVFDALDYAWSEKKLVRIDGGSRLGKTEAVRTWCAKYPGRARLVTVPCSNPESDLIWAVGEAFGMETSFGTRGPKLRDKVEFILRHGRLGVVFDESHFLFPTRYGKNTVPARLNWLRTEVVDRGLPCALVTTPQAYNGQSSRFEKCSGYNLDQFTGRISKCAALPAAVSEKDISAVAKLYFPELSERQLKVVVSAAILSPSYLQAVEDIAKDANWLARRRGAHSASMADIRAAISDVVPKAGNLLARGQAERKPADATKSHGSAASPRGPRERAAAVVRGLRPGGRQTISSVDPVSSPRSEEFCQPPGLTAG